ncbi:hypothetical protein KCU81_g9400, partial [Aureobasidium melanogenum]|uniref:Uncharacterized protein n=1 Tax=Aureobasidium melanogenum (strain CBS 110374) TaxID=1043003 RepID=A0A074VG14_AURM1
MHSTSAYVFSNDARATAFRRAVRSRVAHSQEYAMPGLGASAQEVQREFLRYCAEQDQGQSDGAQQAPPPYTPSTDTQVPSSAMLPRENQGPPPYTSTPTSDMTPTARLDFLLYSNTSTPPLPPDYAEAISAPPPPPPPPPRYGNVISAHTPTSSSRNTDQRFSHQPINNLSTGCTTRTPKKQIHNKAIQALEVVVLPGNGIEVSPKYSSPKKTGILRRIKDRV